MQNFFLKNELATLEYRPPSAPRKKYRLLFDRFSAFMRVLLIVDGVLIIAAAMLSAILDFDIRDIANAFNTFFLIFFYFIPVFLLIPYAVFLHFKLLFKTLIYSANSITREKSPARWDTLALTAVQAQPVIRGKWLACVLHMSKDYAFLALIRAASVIYIALIATRLTTIFFPSMPISLRPNLYLEHPAMPFFSTAFVLLLTLINLPVTASFGILGGFINARHGFIVSGILRTATLITLSAFFILMSVLYSEVTPLYVVDARFYTNDGIFVNTLIFTGESLITNGVGVGIETFNSRGYSDSLTLHAIYAGILLIVIYSLITFINLQAAKWLAKRQGML